MNLLKRLATRFSWSGYDAVLPTNKRKVPGARVLSEDQELRGHQRRQMTTSTRNLQRNFTLAAFMIRKHLDFLTSFSFQAKTGDPDVDKQLHSFVEWWEKPENFDAAGRHGRQMFLRIVESRRVLEGDILVNRLASGRLQGIEGDRIQNEGTPFSELGIDPMQCVNGVFLNQYGGAIGYLAHKRRLKSTGLIWDRYLSARFADLIGYFDRFDQCRGISPMAPSINNLLDTYKNFDYALAKAKVSQLFALAIFRKASDSLGPVLDGSDDEPGEPSETQQPTDYDVRFDEGPFKLDLDPGDDARILQDENPSDQFQSFTQAIIMVSMKALDLPFSFYDESHTNWVGQRQANAQYMLSASIKRQTLLDALNRWTKWRLSLAVMDGDIVLSKGMSVDDVKFEWVPTGIPPVDPLKEVTADIAEVNAGFSSPQRKCRERGDDFFAIIDERAAAEEYARSKGVALSTALPQVFPDNEDKSSGKQNDKANP